MYHMTKCAASVLVKNTRAEGGPLVICSGNPDPKVATRGTSVVIKQGLTEYQRDSVSVKLMTYKLSCWLLKMSCGMVTLKVFKIGAAEHLRK